MKRIFHPAANGRFSWAAGIAAAGLVLSIVGVAPVARAVSDEYWRTDGRTGDTWTSLDWNIGSPTATGGTGWTSGNNAFFTANSTLTFASATVGNVTVTNAATVTVTNGGTLNLGGVRTFDIGTGATLTWQSQTQSTAASNEGAGLIKNGAGILDWGAGPSNNARYDGGFTLNAGTMIVSGNNALSSGPLTFNGGTLQSSGAVAFTSASIVVGGDFELTGTGAASWAANVNLGGATRTITNNAVGSTTITRIFGGTIFGASGTGLIISGAGTGAAATTSTTILSGANTYNGGTTLNTGGILQLSGSGTLGNTSGSLTVNAGRLDLNGTSQTVGNLTGSGGTIVNNASGNITLTIGTGNNGGGNYQGVIADNTTGTGTVSLVKTGNGTITLSGANTYTGTTTINQGTLLLGASNTLKQGSTLRTPVVLGGGTLNTGGFIEGGSATNTLGALTLSANSVIDLSAGNASVLRFADSSSTAWTAGKVLEIDNYSGLIYDKTTGTTSGTAGDALYFSNSASGLTATQLGQISFVNPSGYTGTFGAYINSSGEVFAAIPEPATVLGGALLVGALGWSQRRRVRGLFAGRRSKAMA